MKQSPPPDGHVLGDSVQPEDLLTRLIQSSVDGILAFDRDCRYTVWNPAMERISGVGTADTVGRRAFDVFPFLEEIGEDRFFYAALAGETAVARDRRFTIPGTGKEGYFEGHYSPLRDASGAVIGGLGIIRDITARKKAEASVRESEQRLRLALAAAKMGVWEWDPGKDQVVWSDEVYRIFGVTPQSFGATQAAFMELILPEDRDAVRAVMEAVLRGGRPDFEVEYRISHPERGRRWIQSIGRVVRGEDGQPIKMAGTVLDVSERKRLEADLLRSQRLESVGRLAGGIAHDFNNLLTAVIGYTDLIHDQLADRPPLRSAVEQIRSAADRGAALTQQLLAFASKQIVQPRVVSLNSLILSAEDMLRRLIGADVELKTELASSLWPVRIDPGQFEQVLVNLAVNSSDAMPSGGTLTIRSANVGRDEAAGHGVDAGEWVVVDVEDTGVGMKRETQQLIFEPFFTTKPTGKGTGLGLATCFGIVRQAGGHINVKSAPGSGTRFRVYLPRSTVREVVPAEVSSASELQRGSETVLLVEDDPLVRRVARDTLRLAGYTVLEAANGREALALVDSSEERVELLITDVVMPEMSGEELARTLLARHPEMKVLFISGYSAEVGSRPETVGDGINFVQKPFSVQELTDRVRRILERPRS